jgi:leucyl aminopeptidase (aminopeptidase T)
MKNSKITNSIHNIFNINLKVKETERIIVFTDNYNTTTKKIGKLIVKEGKKFTDNIKHVEIQHTGCHGTEPPKQLWAEAFGINIYNELREKKIFKPILKKKATNKELNDAEKLIKKHRKDAVHAVIALSYFSTSHTRFRDFLNRVCDTRYASMPLFDEKMLTGAMRVDWNNMSRRINEIARTVEKAELINVDTPNGTSINFSRKGREVKKDTGMITKPGSFSNLPAGEVYLAPLEGTAEGRLVLEWAPTRKLKSPITLIVEKGEVIRVEGKEKYTGYLEEKLSEKRENRNIAELGIGTNDKASRPDNILESEKIFGTIHIALGDNSSFGGKVSTSFHQDFVFFRPTITLIYKSGYRKIMMKRGKLFKSV